MDRSQIKSASEALYGVSSWLLSREPSSGDDWSYIHYLLVREARLRFEADGAALARVDREGAHFRVVAADPPCDLGPEAVSFTELPAIERLLVGGVRAQVVTGDDADDIARAGAGPSDAALLLALGPSEAPSYVLVVAWADAPSLVGDDIEAAAEFGRAVSACLAELSIRDGHHAALDRQSALVRAAKGLNESLDLTRVLERICTEAAQIMDGDMAIVWRGNAADGLEIQATYNFPPEAIGHRLSGGEGLAGKVAEEGKPMLTNDYQRMLKRPTAPMFEGVNAVMAVPMDWDGELRGVLAVGYAHKHVIQAESLPLLEAFGELAAVACRNASAHAGLAQVARTDGLTGCLNHAALHESLDTEIERCRRTGQQLSLVLIDLDDFKAVNERYGHLVGDEVLRRVGHALRRSLRPYDLVARYGGDEFVIVAVEAGENDACEIARRAAGAIGATVGELEEGELPIRATAGVAEWNPALATGQLIAQADRALLYGKQEGGMGTAVPASTVPELFRPGRFQRQPTAPPRRETAPELASEVTRQHAERLRRRTRSLALANALGARLAGMTDAQSIVAAAASELHGAFGYSRCGVIQLLENGGVECVATSGDMGVQLLGSNRTKLRATGLIGRCLTERRLVMVNDVMDDPDYRKGAASAGDVRAELVVPLWIGDELWGALNIDELAVGAFDEDDVRLVQTVADLVGSALRSALLYGRLERAYLGTAEALGAAVVGRGGEPSAPARPVGALAVAVGQRLGMAERQLRELRYGAAFHDVGKISVPDATLAKPGPLEGTEREAIERHPVVGEQMLAPIELLRDVRPLIRHEHERFDGKGYPDGLAGEAIPLGSRVLHACAAYDAMRSHRPYRPALGEKKARVELRDGSGTQFDPAVVDALLAVLEERVPPANSGEAPREGRSVTDRL